MDFQKYFPVWDKLTKEQQERLNNAVTPYEGKKAQGLASGRRGSSAGHGTRRTAPALELYRPQGRLPCGRSGQPGAAGPAEALCLPGSAESCE